MSNEDKHQKEVLLRLVNEAVKQDSSLREQFNIGDKFRFIRDRLLALQKHIEESLASLKDESEETAQIIAEDEVLVYVYLYNSQGDVITTWQKMLNPVVFYEYSINRPIYREKADVDAYIRTKPNKLHHAYITIAVKRKDLMVASGAEDYKDSLGNVLIRVREGAFKSSRMMAFTHNQLDYSVNQEGVLIKKSN